MYKLYRLIHIHHKEVLEVLEMGLTTWLEKINHTIQIWKHTPPNMKVFIHAIQGTGDKECLSHSLEGIGFHLETKPKSLSPCRYFSLLTSLPLICTFHHSIFLIPLLFMKALSNNSILHAASAPTCSCLKSFQYLKYSRASSTYRQALTATFSILVHDCWSNFCINIIHKISRGS